MQRKRPIKGYWKALITGVGVSNRAFWKLLTGLLLGKREAKMLARSIQLLEELQYPSGLFSASRKNVTTGYNLSWIRDNVYAALGFEALKSNSAVVRTYRALLEILRKHEYKIDWMIRQPHPKHAHRYIHARFHPETLEEIEGEWGNKQNDAIGAILFKIGELEAKGMRIIRTNGDRQLLHKLVKYLEAIEYWHDRDNGMWEENEELHASSVGACMAGLREMAKIGVEVPQRLISKGEETLNKLLPRESETKETDLSLLSLIYPYNAANEKQRGQILAAVEKHLVREKGVIRYKGDKYYDNKGKEAEWCFGFPWLAIIYKRLGNMEKYAHYISKTMSIANEKGEMPELYYGGTSRHNENTPLGWGQSLSIVALA